MGLHELTAAVQHNLGRVLGLGGRTDEAARLEREAIASVRKQGEPRVEGVARTYLSEILAAGGDYAGAEAEAALAVETLWVAPSLRVAALGALARARLGRGDAERALEAAREAATELGALGEIEEGESSVRLTYAEALAHDGADAEARAALETARERLLARAARIEDGGLARALLERRPRERAHPRARGARPPTAGSSAAPDDGFAEGERRPRAATTWPGARIFRSGPFRRVAAIQFVSAPRRRKVLARTRPIRIEEVVGRETLLSARTALVGVGSHLKLARGRLSKAKITMASVDVPLKRLRFGQTARKDAWWVMPLRDVRRVHVLRRLHDVGAAPGRELLLRQLPVAVLLAGAVRQLAARRGSAPGAGPGSRFIKYSPAMLILIFPLAFRMTCYYYRGAYYKAFWADPPSCAVGEPRNDYRGEAKLPLIIQNMHRYALYFALIFIVLLLDRRVKGFMVQRTRTRARRRSASASAR